MTYQGKRSRPMASENGRYFEVSKVRIGSDGRISDVLWVEVDASSDLDVGARVVVTAAELMDAIHDGARVAAVFSARKAHKPQPERSFVIIEHADGRESIALDGPPSKGRELIDVAALDD